MPYTVLDLFAGCGGLSLGFVSAGFRLIGAIEKDPVAIRTHAKNFFKNLPEPEFRKHATARDITEFPPRRFLREILDLDSPENAVDFIIGGPPCQAFARIGRAKLREIMQHPEAFLQDERASLYVHFLEYVEFFRPKGVLMENVPDIMNFGGKNVAEEIAVTLEDMGYVPRYTILNAAFYGVPQMRERFFLLAFREDLGITPSFPEPTHFLSLPSGYENARRVALKGVSGLPLFQESHYVDPPEPAEDLPPAVTAEEAIGDLPPIFSEKIKRGPRRFTEFVEYRSDVTPSSYARMMRNWPRFESPGGVKDHVTRYLPRDYEIFRRMKEGDQYPEAYRIALEIFKEKLERIEREKGKQIHRGDDEYEDLKARIVPPYDPGKFPNKWWKMRRDMPSRTLTAHIGKDTYSHIHYDSEQARVISVREAARLQSFPDGFEFEGAMNAAFRQIGNAVPPLLALRLAGHILKLLAAQKREMVPLRVALAVT